MAGSIELTLGQSQLWLRTVQANRCAKLRLFCFPHAGGGASVYSLWHRLLPEIEVTAVQLPGHENRISEPLCTEMRQIVDGLYQAFCENLQLCVDSDQPFVFLGHSMGALLAFELARSLRSHQLPMPALLIVSGHRAPHLLSTDEPIHQLPERQFLQKLAEFEGTPAAILAMPEFREVWLPVIRADFELCEGYQYASQPPLNLPIVALYGKDDPQIEATEMEAWSQHSHCPFVSYPLPGEHFYLHTHRNEFISLLQSILDSVIRNSRRNWRGY